VRAHVSESGRSGGGDRGMYTHAHTHTRTHAHTHTSTHTENTHAIGQSVQAVGAFFLNWLLGLFFFVC